MTKQRGAAEVHEGVGGPASAGRRRLARRPAQEGAPRLASSGPGPRPGPGLQK
jgi:hypothetical protein